MIPEYEFMCPKCRSVLSAEVKVNDPVQCPECSHSFRVPLRVATDHWKDHREKELAEQLKNGFDLARVEYSQSNDYPEDQEDPCIPFDGIIFSISGKDRRFPSYQDLVNAGLWHAECLCYAAYVDELIDKEEIKRQAQ